MHLKLLRHLLPFFLDEVYSLDLKDQSVYAIITIQSK